MPQDRCLDPTFRLTFEGCWQRHKENLHSRAKLLKQPWEGEAESLLNRTYDKGERGWARFVGEGNLAREWSWLKTIMDRIHVDDLREGWLPPVAGDAPIGEGYDTLLGQQVDTREAMTSEEFGQQEALFDIIVGIYLDQELYAPLDLEILQADCENQVKDGSLSQEEADAYRKERIDTHFYLVCDDFKAVSAYMEGEDSGANDIRIRKLAKNFEGVVRRWLEEKKPGYSYDNSERLAQSEFDMEFEAVLDRIESENKIKPVYQLRFRRYYSHVEPTQEECAAFCGLKQAGGLAPALKTMREEFCRLWQQADSDVQDRLANTWAAARKGKVEQRERRKYLKSHSMEEWEEILLGEEQGNPIPAEHLDNIRAYLYQQTEIGYAKISHEIHWLEAERRAYKKLYGESALDSDDPKEQFSRRQLRALECQGVAFQK